MSNQTYGYDPFNPAAADGAGFYIVGDFLISNAEGDLQHDGNINNQASGQWI